MVKKNLPIILVLLFAVVSGFSLLHPGLMPTHDGEYHVIRFYEFDKALRGGSMYPRWAPDLNNGYGVPLFNYVYPLPNYIASFFHLLGFSFVDAFRLSLFVATLGGAISFYFFAKEYWGKLGGVVASVLYAFTPYHFVDIYIRGSIGELWALAFFPGFLWSITKISKNDDRKYIIFSGLFLAGIIFSHNILAVMFFIFSLGFVCVLFLTSKNNKQFLLRIGASFGLGVGLSSVFWLPAIIEKKYVTGLQIYSVQENFPELFQLLIPSWGTGFSGGGLQDQMSFQIGIGNLSAVFFAIIAMFVFKKEQKLLVTFFLLSFFILFFLMLRPSHLIWQNVPFFDYFQFPWRFLSLMMIVTAFLAGSISQLRFGKLLSIGFILLTILLTIEYAKPAYYHNRDDQYYVTRSNFIDGTNSPGNVFNTIWFDKTLEKQEEKISSNSDFTVKSLRIDLLSYAFLISANKSSQITINTAYFPGWTAFVDGDKSEIKNKNGLIAIEVPQGKHLVEVRFLDTMVRMMASFVTIFSLCLVIVLSLMRLGGRHT